MFITKYGIMSGGPPAPKIVAAATNVTGTTVTITFDKLMTDPSAYKGEFVIAV